MDYRSERGVQSVNVKSFDFRIFWGKINWRAQNQVSFTKKILYSRIEKFLVFFYCLFCIVYFKQYWRSLDQLQTHRLFHKPQTPYQWLWPAHELFAHLVFRGLSFTPHILKTFTNRSHSTIETWNFYGKVRYSNSQIFYKNIVSPAPSGAKVK